MVSGSTVKSVLKVLGLTITLPLLICLLIEMFNSALTPVYMRGIINKAVSESCGYFAQETYRTDDDTAVFRDTYDILFSSRDTGSNRVVAVSGNFFEHTTQDEIYKDIYYSDRFQSFLSGDRFEFIGDTTRELTSKQGIWENLDRLACGLANKNGWSISQKSLGNEYKSTGNTYVNDHVTALNLGVTYLDEDIIERIAKWNMVANLYRGSDEMIHRHGDDITGVTEEDLAKYDYVTYDGYRIYYNTFQIDSIDYTVYDLSTENGRDEFSKVVHVGEDNTGGDYNYWSDLDIQSDDERKNVCVAEVNYSMNIAYEGVTPIRQAIAYLASLTTKVYGVGGTGPNDDSFYRDHANVTEVTSSKFSSSDDGYILNNYNNKVYYYIVR